ncbi:hypothetical protein EE612_059608, partial [Oryza sativa]
ISSLSRLMESIKRMAVTSPEPRTIRGEESKALQLQPGPSQPGDRRPADKSFWLDATSNAKCYMLSSRLLKVTWGESPEHWKWITLPDSRFAECAELLNVYWLAVIGEIATEDLTPGTRYAVYLVYKLTGTAVGLRGGQTQRSSRAQALRRDHRLHRQGQRRRRPCSGARNGRRRGLSCGQGRRLDGAQAGRVCCRREAAR